MAYTLYKHQAETLALCHRSNPVLDWSSPGTGKSLSHLAFVETKPSDGRALILAPLSILEPAWGGDRDKFIPDLPVEFAYAKNRAAAFASGKHVITNHDAVSWIHAEFRKNPRFLDGFDTLIVDEANAYKNPTSQRTKALIGIRHLFKYRHMLTGTPAPQSLLDLWSLAFIADNGERLGDSYFRFRSQVSAPTQVGPNPNMVQWKDKPGASELIAMQLSDISIRHRKEDCVDIPKNHVIRMNTRLSSKIMNLYHRMLQDSVLEMSNGLLVNAIHAGARHNKLLQICTGAVYDGDHAAQVLHTERYDLVMQLVTERDWPCLVAFNWSHEKNAMVALAERLNVTYAVIDGSVSVTDRIQIVEAFQAGRIKVLFAHPRSAGHGLTLTAGRTTIWSSPTPDAELFLQFNARIDRNGQKHETETILIQAENTKEPDVYSALLGEKVVRVYGLLDLFLELGEHAA